MSVETSIHFGTRDGGTSIALVAFDAKNLNDDTIKHVVSASLNAVQKRMQEEDHRETKQTAFRFLDRRTIEVHFSEDGTAEATCDIMHVEVIPIPSSTRRTVAVSNTGESELEASFENAANRARKELGV